MQAGILRRHLCLRCMYPALWINSMDNGQQGKFLCKWAHRFGFTAGHRYDFTTSQMRENSALNLMTFWESSSCKTQEWHVCWPLWRCIRGGVCLIALWCPISRQYIINLFFWFTYILQESIYLFTHPLKPVTFDYYAKMVAWGSYEWSILEIHPQISSIDVTGSNAFTK